MRVVEHSPQPIREIENLWIPMADGARLSARAWIPECAERNPVPAVVEYIPYRKRDGTAWRDGIMQPYVAGHGYAVLRIDLRGTGESEGLLGDEYTPQEHDDGVAALAWIATQPWCSGRTGMIGVSWGGFNALQIAARRPPSLAAIITICASDDRYLDDAHYMGGAVLNEHAVWGVALLAQAALPPDPALVGDLWRDAWLQRLDNIPAIVARWLMHQRRDAYWQYGSVSEDYSAIACPVYAIGGWADAYRNAVPRLLSRLSVPCKGLVGPWAHGWPLMGEPGPSIGFLQEALRWWDTWLRGVDTGVMKEPQYRVWMQYPADRRPDRTEQPGRWVAEPSWPSQSISERRLFLGPGALADGRGTEVAMSHQSPQFVGRASGAWCPYATGNDLDGDQAFDDAGSLIFDSLPLAEGLDILGAPAVNLDVAVDRPIALLAARLCDVNGAQVSSRVTYGVLNLTHRESHANPTPLEPGKRYRIRLALNDIAYAFPAGHRIRLALSTSYWPIVWPAPKPVALTVYAGSSELVLPARPIRASDSKLPAFGEPEGAAPPAMTTLEPGSSAATWHYDLISGATELVVDHDSGLERFDSIDMTVGTHISERYAITANDPNSAQTVLAWTLRRERADWRVRVEAQIKLRCDAEFFFVQQRLSAFDGKDCVFARDWYDQIERDLV